MMSGQQERAENLDLNQAPPTQQEETEALQRAMRREAATREATPDNEQIDDSGNQEGMGPQGAGHGRRSGRHS
jgi:hypothetical protein